MSRNVHECSHSYRMMSYDIYVPQDQLEIVLDLGQCYSVFADAHKVFK
mgnify:CR=1 FL=1